MGIGIRLLGTRGLNECRIDALDSEEGPKKG